MEEVLQLVERAGAAKVIVVKLDEGKQFAFSPEDFVKFLTKAKTFRQVVFGDLSMAPPERLPQVDACGTMTVVFNNYGIDPTDFAMLVNLLLERSTLAYAVHQMKVVATKVGAYDALAPAFQQHQRDLQELSKFCKRAVPNYVDECAEGHAEECAEDDMPPLEDPHDMGNVD